MNDLLLHPQTRQAIEQVMHTQTHALLITGDLGSGKHTVALQLTAQLLAIKTLENAPYFTHIVDETKALGIEQIRELQKFMQLKTTGKKVIRRIAIIENADTLTTEAQNALLKLLEEPPADTVLILTASQPQKLKPTIHSRSQNIVVLSPSKQHALQYFMQHGHSSLDIERTHSISNGQVGLLTALLEGKTEHTLAKQIIVAKQLYGMTAFQRLAKVDELAKQKDTISDLLYACKRICTSALENAATKGQHDVVSSWHRQLSLITDAENSLRYNPNLKLLLTDLFISI